MSKNHLHMDKFLAGAITATMVATAVTPVAAAEPIDFSDVNKNNSHYPNIIQAAERGLMTGFEGKFNPGQTMTRGQVVKALGKYIINEEELSLDAYVKKHNLLEKVTPFNDVPANTKDQELFKYSLIVKENGVFTGDQNHLKPTDNILRQQMSKVLVEAFNLEDIEGVEANVVDLDRVQNQYKNYVAILSKHQITKADDNNFNPTGNLLRQQMASFLNRAYDVIHSDEVQVTEVKTIEPVNTTILQTNDVDDDYKTTYKLAVHYLDENKKPIAQDNLPEDLHVTFVDNKDVFNEDGTIKNASKIGAKNGEIKVVATVTSASQQLALTKEFTVDIIAAADYATITEIALLNGDVTVNTAVVGDQLTLIPRKVVQNDGTKLDATKESNPDTIEWNKQVGLVSSSHTELLAIEYDGQTIKLNPIAKGKATISIVLNSGYIFTKTFEVESVARIAAKATATDLTVSTTENQEQLDVVVTDQYGDPVYNESIYAHPSTNQITTAPSLVKTNKEGKASFQVTANESGTVKISTNEDATKVGLATSNVTFVEAGAVTNYDLRIHAKSKSKDATLDVNDPKDDALKLDFVGKDKNGVIAKVYNKDQMGTTYQVTSTDKNVATASIAEDGTIDVLPKLAGTTTISVKEGNIVRANFKVTVNDTTPILDQLKLRSNATLTAKENETYKLTDEKIAELIEVKDFEVKYDKDIKPLTVKNGEKTYGYVDFITSNSSLLTVSNGNTITTTNQFNKDHLGASLIFRLVDTNEEVINSTSLELTYDNIAPDAPIFTATPVTNDNYKNYTLSGTAEAGSTVAIALAIDENDEKTVEVIADKAGNWATETIDLSKLNGAEEEATIHLLATATDAAKNKSAVAETTITYPTNS